MNKEEVEGTVKRLKERFADSFSVSREAVTDDAHITMAGNSEIYIENYRGIIEYKQDIIRLFIKDGVLLIEGRGLLIQSLRPEDIFIRGAVSRVEFFNI